MLMGVKKKKRETLQELLQLLNMVCISSQSICNGLASLRVISQM